MAVQRVTRAQLGNHKAAVLEIGALDLLRQLYVFATCLRDSGLQHAMSTQWLELDICMS